MSPFVASLIASFFMRNGKPNKILGKLGQDTLGALLEETFKDGKPTMKTLETISKLNGGKKKGLSAQQKKAMEFLEKGGAKRDTGSYVMQDIIAPLLSGGAKTVGNALAAQYMAPAMAAQAAANGFQINPIVAQGTAGGRLMSMAIPAMAAAHQGAAAAKGTMATGLANTFANTVAQAANTARAENLMERQQKNMLAQRQLSGVDSRPSEGEWNYMNQQMKAYNKAAGGN